MHIWSQEQHIQNWPKTDTVWTGRPGSGRPAYFLWNLGMRFYQYHPKGEIKPFQWVVSQNARVGIGRLEPLGKTEEFCAMIRAQDNYPSRSDLQPLRSVSVQRRAESLPEPGHPAQTMSVWRMAFCTDYQGASGASNRRRWTDGMTPRPAISIDFSRDDTLLEVTISRPRYED